jgi:Caenorhabditis protein of unknown function, DUF268
MKIAKSTSGTCSSSVHRICVSVSSSKFLSFVISAALLVWVGIQLGFRSVDAPASTPTPGSHLWTLEQTEAKLKKMRLAPIFDAKKTVDPWKAELFQRLDRIRVVCGLLCQMNTAEELQQYSIEVPGSVFPMIRVKTDCPAILGSEDIDAADNSVPAVPDELKHFYTFDGKIAISGEERLSNIYLGVPEARVWTKEALNQAVDEAKHGKLGGTYGVDATTFVRDDMADMPIRGKSVMVIGSENPWVEAILLHHGATKVTTLEYASLVSEHPKVQTLTPHQFRKEFLAGALESFDGVVSFSSVEHSGLGRYGDALNPWGDILAIARAWCVTKEGGFMYLGLPSGNDGIVSNWHRIYGLLRWPLVAANWKPLPNGSKLKEDAWVGSGYKFTKDSHRPTGE